MDPRPTGRASNAGLVVVGMLLGAFGLIAAACLTEVTLTGTSGSAPTRAQAPPSAGHATGRIRARVAHAGWRQRSVQPIALAASKECAPIGWNAGPTSRERAVLDHLS